VIHFQCRARDLTITPPFALAGFNGRCPKCPRTSTHYLVESSDPRKEVRRTHDTRDTALGKLEFLEVRDFIREIV
jgi:hypothetical protein